MVSETTAAGATRAALTNRKDWDALLNELYASVIAGVPFGVGIVTKHKGLLGTSLKQRLNQRFPNSQVPQFIRKRFQVAQLDRIFSSEAGLERGERGLYKVVGDDLGLPRNCLLFPFQSASDPAQRGVILFGGERMGGMLDAKLQAAEEVLSGSGRSSPLGGLPLESHDQLVEKLAKINVKRLYEQDMDVLARIVNGLEDSKEELPKHLKPIFRTVSEYILKHRLKRGR